MAQTLVKFKHIEDISDNTNFIKAIWTNDPLTILQLAKETDSTMLKDETYTYEFSELIPAESREFVDVLMIYVDGYGDGDSEYYLS